MSKRLIRLCLALLLLSGGGAFMAGCASQGSHDPGLAEPSAPQPVSNDDSDVGYIPPT